MTKYNFQKLLSRRSVIVAAIAGTGAAISAALFLNNAKEQRLVTDPDGDEFVYRDGYIIKLNR